MTIKVHTKDNLSVNVLLWFIIWYLSIVPQFVLQVHVTLEQSCDFPCVRPWSNLREPMLIYHWPINEIPWDWVLTKCSYNSCYTENLKDEFYFFYSTQDRNIVHWNSDWQIMYLKFELNSNSNFTYIKWYCWLNQAHKLTLFVWYV